MSKQVEESSGSSTPEPPDPMDVEEGSFEDDRVTGEDTSREAAVVEKKDELDLEQMAREFAGYLVVDSKQDVSWNNYIYCVLKRPFM